MHRENGRGAAVEAPSWTVDALHKQLDKHRGQTKDGGLYGAAEAKLSERGGSGQEATQSGAVGDLWGCCV